MDFENFSDDRYELFRLMFLCATWLKLYLKNRDDIYWYYEKELKLADSLNNLLLEHLRKLQDGKQDDLLESEKP